MSANEKPSQLTPMLRQYHEIKKQYPGTLLFFRLGDFYEMFYDDALIGSREMEITLTARHKEKGSPIPMCGVPYHAASSYITKLVKKGYRIAICEQAEPTQTAKLVKREVVRVITPGTAIENQLLEVKQNNYLAAVCGSGQGMGLALLDLSTGEFLATEFIGSEAWGELQEQLRIFEPREILFPHSLTPLFQKTASTKSLSPPIHPAQFKEHNAQLANSFHTVDFEQATFTAREDWHFGFEHANSLLRTQLKVASLDGFGLQEKPFAICAAGAALHYVCETQRSALDHLSEITFFEQADFQILDAQTINNLELVTSSAGKKNQSLIAILDQTLTGMGARTLRQWLLRPLVKLGEINARLDAVGELKATPIKRDQIRRQLEPMVDLERLSGKIILGRANARDLQSLRNSLVGLPNLRKIIAESPAALLQVLAESLDELADIVSVIAERIADDPPASPNEPGMICNGFNAKLDELRNLAQSNKSYIAAIEARERGRTGIATLKVKYNNIFGYFIEINNSHKDKTPANYERKQTLVNSERFTTPELKEYELKVLDAEEHIIKIEMQIFSDVCAIISKEIKRIQATARTIAYLDCLTSLAEVAAKQNYVRPTLHDGDEIHIIGGRHPIIEILGERFIPNDLLINNSTDRLLIITGPNMGGKSVFLKQAALISLMAQMGSYVPATSANLALVDRIFTRVGASDNLALGRSTFMVEMTETSNILNTATPRSLVLLDEVGRGTATFDGLSLAWAIAEYLHDNNQHCAKTLFATHYHELTELAKLRPGVKNYQVAVSEASGDIVFLRRVIPGSASKSYGIEVARLAGLPKTVIERAREILMNLEQNELDVTGKPKFARHLKKPSKHTNQLSLLDQPQDEITNAPYHSAGDS